MKRKQQAIFIWSFIIIASFVLALLYTPLGGNLHSAVNAGHQNFTSGVSFGGKIGNSPRIKASQPYIKTEDEIKSNNNYPKNAQNIKSSSSKNYSQETTSSYAVSGKTIADTQTPASNGNSGALFAAASTGKGKGSTLESGIASANQPFSSEIENSSAVMQRAGQATGDLADPGGSDPGAPIPVGDGIPFLLILATLYFFYSAKKNKQKKLAEATTELQ